MLNNHLPNLTMTIPMVNFSRPLSDSPPKHSPTHSTYSPAFDNALHLLDFDTYTSFEAHFLNTPAFLGPWSDFRDQFLLHQPAGMPRTSLPGKLTRGGVLWMYTIMEDGKYRPKDDTKERHELVDKTPWEVLEHEKYLFAWLLQNFRVGKEENEFRYFQLRNICTAFEEVFLPIIETVVSEYDMRGRRFYGRFAKFIESVSPSRIAFPELTVGAAVGEEADLPAPPPPPKDTGRVKFAVGPWMERWNRQSSGSNAMNRQFHPELDKPILDLMDWLWEQRTKAEAKRKKAAALRPKTVPKIVVVPAPRNVSAPAILHAAHKRMESKGSTTSSNSRAPDGGSKSTNNLFTLIQGHLRNASESTARSSELYEALEDNGEFDEEVGEMLSPIHLDDYHEFLRDANVVE